ncbi:hypothetical protein [Pseudomonas sp.]|uniref:hypothetical protein n=1 Tax=Pseudomonas sp. TaxID=306 RepID=UPI00290F3A41|nr:hypothetical protein [Pseudomonas sp.]MDU4250364.1 hypothetical protein [Pseudomonas sp.]
MRAKLKNSRRSAACSCVLAVFSGDESRQKAGRNGDGERVPARAFSPCRDRDFCDVLTRLESLPVLLRRCRCVLRETLCDGHFRLVLKIYFSPANARATGVCAVRPMVPTEPSA